MADNHNNNSNNNNNDDDNIDVANNIASFEPLNESSIIITQNGATLVEGLEDVDLETGRDKTSQSMKFTNLPSNIDDDSQKTTPATSNDMNAFLDASKGFHLRWSRLQKEVKVKSDSNSGFMFMCSKSISANKKLTNHTSPSVSTAAGGATLKVILNQVSGSAAPGELLACMGPSGSGKTSLMNVLSGRSLYQHGVMSINGEPMNAHTMKRFMSKVAYVKQTDIFFGHLTVRDQFTYTALLRLPSDISWADKHRQVDEMIHLLRLTKVAESPICMLSGGEKKRVNIGTELLTNPAVILLDEPTSGLDSTSAVSLLKMLHKLAHDQMKTIITTIHQPSSSVFMSFDKLTMLSEGNAVYYGTPRDSLHYLALDKVKLPCPPGYNAADHWMDLLVIDSAVEEEREGGQQSEHGTGAAEVKASKLGLKAVVPRLLLQQVWDSEGLAQQLDRELTSTADDASITEQILMGSSKYPITWWAQFTILLHRALKNSRSAIFTWINTTKSLAIGVIVGLLWFRTDYTESRIQDIRSYCFFTMVYWGWDRMFNAVAAFPAEREVILKERASRTYQLSAYFMAKTASDASTRFILPLLYIIVSYWMTGIGGPSIMACTFLSVIVGEAIGLLIGAAIYDLQKATTFATVLGLGLMLLGGYFVQQIPVWIEWTKYLSPFKYLFDLSLQIVFNRPVPCDGSGALQSLCPNGAEGSISVPEVLGLLEVNGSIRMNRGLPVLFYFVPRCLAYLALRMKKEGDRS